MNVCCASLTALALCVGAAAQAEDGRPFHGEWRTTIGIVHLNQQGNQVTGTYGTADQFKLEGSVAEGRVLTFDYEEGTAKGAAKFTLDGTGHAFTGNFQVRGGPAGQWNG